MWILRGFLGEGRQTTVGLPTTAIFGVFGGYLTGYIVPRQLFSDLKCVTLNDPYWLFHAKFRLPSRCEVFDALLTDRVGYAWEAGPVTFPYTLRRSASVCSVNAFCLLLPLDLRWRWIMMVVVIESDRVTRVMYLSALNIRSDWFFLVTGSSTYHF